MQYYSCRHSPITAHSLFSVEAGRKRSGLWHLSWLSSQKAKPFPNKVSEDVAKKFLSCFESVSAAEGPMTFYYLSKETPHLGSPEEMGTPGPTSQSSLLKRRTREGFRKSLFYLSRTHLISLHLYDTLVTKDSLTISHLIQFFKITGLIFVTL